MNKSTNNSVIKSIPKFIGDTPDKLVRFAEWAQENTPGRPYTLEEIAGVAGVTRERIRQIEARALKKLRNPEHLKQFDGVQQYQ